MLENRTGNEEKEEAVRDAYLKTDQEFLKLVMTIFSKCVHPQLCGFDKGNNEQPKFVVLTANVLGSLLDFLLIGLGRVSLEYGLYDEVYMLFYPLGYEFPLLDNRFSCATKNYMI